MVINRLLIPHKHRSYTNVDKYGDTISRYSSYSRHSKYTYRQPSNSHILSQKDPPNTTNYL